MIVAGGLVRGLHRCRTVLGVQTWEVFSQGASLGEYTSAVLDYINFCTKAVLTTKTIRVFPNQKLWLNSNVRSPLRSRDAAFRSGNMLAYTEAQRDLKKGVREERTNTERTEGQFENNNTQRMWRGLKP